MPYNQLPSPVCGGAMPRDAAGNLPQPSEWPKYMRGNADAVVFFREIAQVVAGADTVTVKRVLVPSLEPQAFTYLRPVDREAGRANPITAPAWRFMSEKFLGLNAPVHAAGVAFPAEIIAEAEAAGRALGWHFILDFPGGYFPCHPDHRYNWRWVKAEEGVWCGFYVSA
jgi:hypothetical protein